MTTCTASPILPRPLPHPGHSRRRRPWAQLLNAVLDLAGPEAEFVSHGERPWASVTFAGSRHTIALGFSGAAAIAAGEAFAAALPGHEFAIPRQLVADAVVTAMHHEARPAERLEIEAELLLVEDC